MDLICIELDLKTGKAEMVSGDITYSTGYENNQQEDR